jgi:hypothetical protein
MGYQRGIGAVFNDEIPENRVQGIFVKELLDSSPGIHKGPAVHRGVAQPGRAPRLGRGCRQFESGRPDHFIFNDL